MLLRALVLLLLAMNVGAAAWWALRPPPPPIAQLPAAEADIATLTLLSEVDVSALPQVAEGAEPPELMPSRVSRECLEIGPFLTQSDLRRALAALTPGAARIQYREAMAVVQRGYRVFLPAPASREAALAEARGLFGRGIRDYYVVTSGAEENTISFGLYRSEANAQRRQEEVRGLGIEALVEPRSESIPQFWVDLESDAGFNWRDSLGGYSGVAERSIPCD